MDSNIVGALIGAGATVAAAVITIVYSRRNEQPSPSNRHTLSTKSFGGSTELDSILARLEPFRQRATFGAVAGILGRDPSTLLEGYSRSPRTSWVVNKSIGEPTGQDGAAIHPELFKNAHVISDARELKSWLAAHPAGAVDGSPTGASVQAQEKAQDAASRGFADTNATGPLMVSARDVRTGAISPQAILSLKRLLEELKAKAPSRNEVTLNLDQITAAKSTVIARYNSAFSPGNVETLSRETFLSFLRFENNRHWYGLDRNGEKIVEDMHRLRGALAVLVDESQPLSAG